MNICLILLRRPDDRPSVNWYKDLTPPPPPPPPPYYADTICLSVRAWNTHPVHTVNHFEDSEPITEMEGGGQKWRVEIKKCN